MALFLAWLFVVWLVCCCPAVQIKAWSGIKKHFLLTHISRKDYRGAPRTTAVIIKAKQRFFFLPNDFIMVLFLYLLLANPDRSGSKQKLVCFYSVSFAFGMCQNNLPPAVRSDLELTFPSQNCLYFYCKNFGGGKLSLTADMSGDVSNVYLAGYVPRRPGEIQVHVHVRRRHKI